MKTVSLFFIFILIFLLFFQGCILQVINTTAGPPAPAHWTIPFVSGIILSLYEILVRVVPTVQNYSVISFVINLLKLVSDKLNISKG